MGRYIDWDDVIDRYPEIESIGGASEVGSAFVQYAESMVDGLLASHFTVPFSNNNSTVRDLSIDCTYWRAGRQRIEDATIVGSLFLQQIQMLKDGQMLMVTDSGTAIAVTEKNQGLYSTTQSYVPVFGLDDPIDWRVSSTQLGDLHDLRYP